MARGHRPHNRIVRMVQREAYDFASEPFSPPLEALTLGINRPLLGPTPFVRSPLLEVEDDRLYRPDLRTVPSRTSKGLVSRPSLMAARHTVSAGRLKFENPEFTVRCVRRRQRDEVLHALKRTGKGSGRPRRRNSWSNITCR